MKNPHFLSKQSIAKLAGGFAIIVVAALLGPMPDANAASKSKLTVHIKGIPATGLPCTPAGPSAVLMGGGIDVNMAFSWMINKANCGSTPSRPGNVVVLRTTGNGAYDKFIYDLGGVAAVQTLIIPDKDSANDAALDDLIANAALIWIAGGDQSVYYNQWKGTRLENLVQQQIKLRHAPFGGTSAGLAMLGNFIYVGAPSYSVTSAEALANPYNTHMNLQQDFWSANIPAGSGVGPAPLPVLRNTVTDSHFDTRDRMGRTLTFMARALADGWVTRDATNLLPHANGSAYAISVDEQTALLLDADTDASSMRAAIVSNPGVAGYAYLMNTTAMPMCKGKPMNSSCNSVFSMAGTSIIRLAATSTVSEAMFDMSAWTPMAVSMPFKVKQYSIDIVSGVLSSTGNGGSIY